MARTYLVFGDIDGKLDVFRVECTKCDPRAAITFTGNARGDPMGSGWRRDYLRAVV
jgi:hypothetical protein